MSASVSRGLPGSVLRHCDNLEGMNCPECERLREQEKEAARRQAAADEQRRAFQPGKPFTVAEAEDLAHRDRALIEATARLEVARRETQTHRLTHGVD